MTHLHGSSLSARVAVQASPPLGAVRELPALGSAATAAGVFAASLIAYLATAPRTIASSDSAELTTAAVGLGIPHPPGYPLYVLIGHVFSLVPLGDAGFRLNLMSACFGALAATLVFAIVFELTARKISALVASLSLAFSYHFWGESLVAEVYTLDAALVAGLIYTLCLWQRTRRLAALYGAFFLLGLSFAHRTTSLLIVPPLVVWAIRNGCLRDLDHWLLASCAAIPGLLLYLLLPLLYMAQPSYMWSVGYDMQGNPIYADLTTQAGWTWYVTAKIFRPLAFAYAPQDLPMEAVRYLGWLWGEFAGFGVILGLLGIRAAWRAHRDFLLLTAGILVLQAAFYMDYAALDKDQMLLPTYLMWSLWIGLGTIELLRLIDTGYLRSFAAPAARLLVLALPLALLLINAPRLDFSGNTKVRDDTSHLFAAAPSGTLVIGEWGDIAVLQYFQIVEHERPDLRLVAQWSLSASGIRELIGANIDKRPVYLLEDVPPLHEDFRFVKMDSWYQVRAR